MKSASEIRRLAREQLKLNPFSKNWMMALLLELVCGVLLSIAGFTLVGAILLTGALTLGFCATLLKIVRTREPANIGDLFTLGFTNNFGQTVGLFVLEGIFVFLWSLLFFIPGIIKSYSYSMSFFILADHPEYSWSQAHKASIEMMKGKKWKLFCLQFSFIGWILLSCLTFGILLLWVAPYYNLAMANFYNENKPKEAVAAEEPAKVEQPSEAAEAEQPAETVEPEQQAEPEQPTETVEGTVVE